MSVETSVILHAGWQSGWQYAFVFFATLSSYNLYYIKSTEFSYHAIFTIVGTAGSAVSLIMMPIIPYVYLAFITILSLLYLLPVFVSFRKSSSYSFQRLLILILVWVLFTFQFQTPHHVIDLRYGLLLLYRILLLSHLCVIFFIRDERNQTYKRMAAISCIPLGVLQLVVSILIMLQGDIMLAVIYLFISLLMIRVSRHVRTNSMSTTYYLLFVDGIMLLQSAFVVITLLSTSWIDSRATT